jgi:hypothetical protein
MKRSNGEFVSTADRRREPWILAASACATLLPYFIYHRLFARLFWFGDEFDLIGQFDRIGFWKWVWLTFAENFVPLFKVLWGGAVIGFGGSYAAMIAIVWLTHALNVALLGRVMRTCGLSWSAVFIAQVVFGLTPANCETLGWSVQWSAMLSITFMLLGLEFIFRSRALSAPLGFSAASALSFSRGALTGPLLAAAYLIGMPETNLRSRVVRAAALMVPSFAIAALIFLLATGNQHTIGGHLPQAAAFGAWYFSLNPAYLVLSFDSWGWRTTVLLGIAKAALFIWALLRARGLARTLFVVLILFDLGNAALLGIGRYHTGLAAAVSSRYQYASLIATMPMVAFWVTAQIKRVLAPPVERIFVAVCLAGAAFLLCRQWPAVLGPFSEMRGSLSRQIFFEETHPGVHAVPGIPGMDMVRAKELIRDYHLH